MNGITSLRKQPVQLQENNDLRPVVLRLEGVSMVYGRRQILRNVNLTVRRGDFMIITGPNGGGKTTLMRIILQLIKPTAGAVEYLQKNLRIGYLPQKSSIDSSFPISVREVVASGLATKEPNKRERVEETLREVELGECADKPFGALSGGQQQRALLARAIISRPEMLVLDEPLSYLDKRFEEKTYNILERISPHTTILLVSHEITRAATMASRHIIVNTTLQECQSARHFANIALCD